MFLCSFCLSDKVQYWIQGVANNIKQGTSLSGLNCTVYYWWHSSVLDIYPVQYVYWTTTGSPTRSVYLWSLYLGIQTRGKPPKHTAIFLKISIFFVAVPVQDNFSMYHAHWCWYEWCLTMKKCCKNFKNLNISLQQFQNGMPTFFIWYMLLLFTQQKFEIASPAWKKYHCQQHYHNQLLYHYLKSHLGSRRWRNHVTKNSSCACHTTPQDYRSSKGGWTP